LKKILIISPESWGTCFVSKHHYANELSKLGHEVFFLNPPSDTKLNFTLANEPYQKVKVIDYKAIRGVNRLSQLFKNGFNKRTINQILKKTGPLDLVISFDPFRFQNLNQFEAKKTIYFPADWHNNPMEKEISQSADAIISVSSLLADQYKQWNSQCLSIGHGVSEVFFDTPKTSPIQLEGNNKLKVGYVGNLNYNLLDFEALERILIHNTHIDFYFIGPNGKSNLSQKRNDFWDKMELLEHVHLLGSKKYEELKYYLAQFDVLLLCYKGFDNKIFLSNNHKMLEYLSSGKPIISHYTDEYSEKEDLLYMIKDEKEDFDHFFNKISSNLDNLETPLKKEIRIAFAKENIYKNKAVRLLELIDLYE